MKDPKKRRGCLWWIGVVTIAGVVALSIALYAIKATGRARLQAERAAVAAAGESLDPADFAPAPVPREDDAAVLIEEAMRSLGPADPTQAQLDRAIAQLSEAARRPQCGKYVAHEAGRASVDDLDLYLLDSIEDAIARRDPLAAYDRIAAKLLIAGETSQGWEHELTTPSGTAALLARAAALAPPSAEQRACMMRWVDPRDRASIETQIERSRARTEGVYQLYERREYSDFMIAEHLGLSSWPRSLKSALASSYLRVFFDMDHAAFLAYAREHLASTRRARASGAPETDTPEPTWPIARDNAEVLRDERGDVVDRRSVLDRLRAAIEATGK